MSEEITPEDLQRAKERQRTINAYHRTFSSEDGRRVLEDLKSVFGIQFPAFVPRQGGEYDTHHAAIRDGQRQVILHVESVLAEEMQGDANVDQPQVTVKTE
jgi:hypothetical protein